MKRLLHFFRGNALALASLSIALMGLYLTITAQREERAHKELLLRPVLNIEVDVADYSVSIFNYGLGPAMITDTVYYLGGQCRAVNQTNVDQFVKTDLVKVGRDLSNFFVQQFAEAKWKDDWKSSPAFRVTMPLPSQIVTVGQGSIIFKLDAEVATEVHAKLRDLGVETRQIFNDQLVTRSVSVPLRLRYCSMSEQYCRFSGGRSAVISECRTEEEANQKGRPVGAHCFPYPAVSAAA